MYESKKHQPLYVLVGFTYLDIHLTPVGMHWVPSAQIFLKFKKFSFFSIENEYKN